MGEERYLYSDAKYEEELDRLRLQESFVDPVTIRHLETVGVAQGWRCLARAADTHDPATIRHLETIGVSVGWKCLETGAGAGSIAKWLSGRVGSTGKVVATDINMRFLNRISAPNLEIRRHDILRDDLEKDTYDLTHCRFLLMRALTPITKTSRTIFDYHRNKHIVDVYFGRRVRSLVEGLGFMDVGHEGWTFILRGGEPYTHAYEWAWWTAVLPNIPEGTVTTEQNECVQRLYLDPTFYTPWSTVLSAWGRKPAGERRS